MRAYLVFEDGEVFPGTWIGTPREVPGEVVFTTGMTGFPGVMTDPAHAGQIVTFTYPLIGNCGPALEGVDQDLPRCAGVVVSGLCEEEGVGDWLDRHGVPGITGVDTRKVVRKVRKSGAIRGMISSTPTLRVKTWPANCSLQWVTETTVQDRIQLPAPSPEAPHLVLIDLGTDTSTLEHLRRQGCRVTVVPFSTPPGEIKQLAPEGLLFSGGPGDPKALLPFLKGWQALLLHRIPTLGVGLGHQVLALACGADTERLACGHRGNNHPVKETETGRVWITSQNHGYTVTASSLNPAHWVVTHRHVQDGSVEGLAHCLQPLSSIQFHLDNPAAEGVFLRFLHQVKAKTEVEIHG
ncbi:carbamoyl-phosphate synthase small chain [Kroppenstedtia guangzhouensis]|jgi:carbamoyl-phosphate synthase small subunit|uniref:carbamoyl-phosphate synthase (glutamine-hydrolyzing) n=1 Tax=Kroppenstedtia guangzhouensis TaxID=1274356 RepID=A0ABQ1GKC0_9BACL|nr:carbamoyl phosphate synthase small subunit [Kroppenstedtia guangzhouensis]GGA45307.1 carbamoyl-phosphate synthase small chain [Kroppenstedtia guangzhouensis]